MAYSATAKDLTRPGASFARRYGLAFASVTGALLLELLFHCAFRATSPNRAPSKKRPTVSHMSTRRNFMNCSQLTFPASRPHSWRARRYSTLRTVSQRRSPRRLENQAELDAGGGKRSNHQPGPGTLVCQAGQQPYGRSRRRQPRSLRLTSQRGCRFDSECRTCRLEVARTPQGLPTPGGLNETSRNSVVTKRRIFRLYRPHQIIHRGVQVRQARVGQTQKARMTA